MTRVLVLGAVLLLAGCAGVPPAVVWATTGAGLGYLASANNLATEALKVWGEDKPGDKP